MIDTIKRFWLKDADVEKACIAAMEAIFCRRKKAENSGEDQQNIRTRLKDSSNKTDEKEFPQGTKNVLIAGALMIKCSDTHSSQLSIYLSAETLRGYAGKIKKAQLGSRLQ